MSRLRLPRVGLVVRKSLPIFLILLLLIGLKPVILIFQTGPREVGPFRRVIWFTLLSLFLVRVAARLLKELRRRFVIRLLLILVPLTFLSVMNKFARTVLLNRRRRFVSVLVRLMVMSSKLFSSGTVILSKNSLKWRLMFQLRLPRLG